MEAVLDIAPGRTYGRAMKIERHTVEIDVDTDVQLRELAAERGQDVATVLADAVALLVSVSAGPDVSEDRRRLEAFERTGLAVPFDDMKAWVASWGSENELPRPQARKIG